jgi:hypothetical protein
MTLPDISRWDHDDDPITRDQVRVLYELLNDEVSELALEGFLIVASRLVDEFGGHRTTMSPSMVIGKIRKTKTYVSTNTFTSR